MCSIVDKVTIGVLGEGCIDPGYHGLTQFIWNDLDKFRTGPIGPLLLLVHRAPGPGFQFGNTSIFFAN